MKIGVVIQARMGSSRLQGKVLLPFYNDKTILSIIVDKIKKIDDTETVIATSTNPNNDVLEDFCLQNGIKCFRGDENDVLNRFISAAKQFDFENIIRICSDNPFLDCEGLQKLVSAGRSSDADYIGFMVNGLPSIKTHFGFWAEYTTLKTLEDVQKRTSELLYHEHVTNYIYTHPELYKIEWIDAPQCIDGRNDIRLTIDTQRDFDNAARTYNVLYAKNHNFKIEDVINYIDNNADLAASMKDLINSNGK